MTVAEPGSAHEPVMVAEVTEYLAGRGTVVDMTLGAGATPRPSSAPVSVS